MLFILQILTLIAYLFNGYIGFGISIILYLNIWMNKKYSIVEKTIISLIISIPFYNIGILGIDMHHIFSWYNIYIIIFIIYLLCNILTNKINKLVLLFTFFLVSYSTINLFIFPNLGSAVVDYFQIIVFIIATMLAYQFRAEICKSIKSETKVFLEKVFNNTLLLIAIGIIVQYVLSNYFSINTGIITYFSERVVYDLFFKGYSVASILLGLGVIINVNKIFYEKKFIFTLLKIIILLLAIVINTSRTGLIVSFLVSSIILLRNIFKNKRNFTIGIFFVGIFLLMFSFSISGITSNRSISDGILDDNGRFETYASGIEAITNNLTSFLFGNGLSSLNYDFMMPHNFIIEISLKLGVIFTIVILGLFIKLIMYVKNTFLRLIIIYILLCNLFVTGFYQMSFIIAIIVYVIICYEKEYRRNDKK